MRKFKILNDQQFFLGVYPVVVVGIKRSKENNFFKAEDCYSYCVGLPTYARLSGERHVFLAPKIKPFYNE